MNNQLIARDKELAKLYEEIKLLSSQLLKGAKSYQETVSALSRDKEILQHRKLFLEELRTENSNVNVANRERIRLGNELTTAKSRLKLLEGTYGFKFCITNCY